MQHYPSGELTVSINYSVIGSFRLTIEGHCIFTVHLILLLPQLTAGKVKPIVHSLDIP